MESFANISMCNELIPFEPSGRFHMVVCIGTTLAIMGVLGNTVLLRVLLGVRKYRRSVAFYLGCCALFDVFFDIGYILIMVTHKLADYSRSGDLNVLFHTYIREAFMMTHSCKIASTFCLIAASQERYRAASHWTFTGYTRTRRLVTVLILFFGACVLRAPAYIDMAVIYKPLCPHFTDRYSIRMDIDSGFVYWLRTFITALVPFVMLLYLNIGIIVRLHKQRERHMRTLMMQFAMGEQDVSEQDNRIKHAMQSLVAIVCAYLLSNCLNVILLFLEGIDVDRLHRDHKEAYDWATDLSSLLSVAGNVVRPPIYAICDPEMRRALYRGMLRMIFKPVGCLLGESPAKPTRLNRMISTRVPHVEDGAIARIQRFNERLQRPDTPPARREMNTSVHLLRALSLCIFNSHGEVKKKGQNKTEVTFAKRISKCNFERLTDEQLDWPPNSKPIFYTPMDKPTKRCRRYNTISLPVDEPQFYAHIVVDESCPIDGTLV